MLRPNKQQLCTELNGVQSIHFTTPEISSWCNRNPAQSVCPAVTTASRSRACDRSDVDEAPAPSCPRTASDILNRSPTKSVSVESVFLVDQFVGKYKQPRKTQL